MRACVRRILVFLLLGTIVNVAAAWGIAAANTRHLQRVFYFEELCWCMYPDDDKRHYLHLLEQFGFTRAMSAASGRVKVRHSGAERSEIPEYTGPIWWEAARLNELHHMQFASGWPARSLRAHYDVDWASHRTPWSPTGPWVIQTRWFGGFDLSRWGDVPASLANVVLPLRVIPMGFAQNTAFYGAAFLLFATMIRSARAMSRTRRGLCPACAYPRGSSPVCTECGEALPC